MDNVRASVHAWCTARVLWPLFHVRMLMNFLFMYFILLKSAVHGHGRGTRLGTCLVQLQCVSCVVASATCMTADKCSVLLMMTQRWLCTGMDEACTLVRALCNSSVSRVSLLSSMFHCFHFLVGRGHARGMRLGTRPLYAICGVAFAAGITGAGWCCPKTLYARK